MAGAMYAGDRRGSVGRSSVRYGHTVQGKTRTLTHTHTRLHARTHARTRTYTHRRERARAHTPPPMPTHSLAHTRTHARARAHTHTHTRGPDPPAGKARRRGQRIRTSELPRLRASELRSAGESPWSCVTRSAAPGLGSHSNDSDGPTRICAARDGRRGPGLIKTGGPPRMK